MTAIVRRELPYYQIRDLSMLLKHGLSELDLIILFCV